MNQTKAKNASRNIFWGMINKAFVVLMPFINRTILIYAMGAEYLGLDGLFLSVLQMLNIAELGISSAIIFSLYKPIAEKNVAKVNALINLYQKAYRYIGCVVLVIGLLILPFIPKLIKGGIPEELNLYTLYAVYLLNTVLGYWLFAYKKSILLANQREDILSKINVLVICVKTVLQILTITVTHWYYGYVLIMPFITVLENLIVAYISKKYYPEIEGTGKLEECEIKDIKKRVSGLMIQKVCAASRNSMDNIIISAYIGLTMVTAYGNYYSIVAAVHSVFLGVTTSVSAIVGNTIATENVEKNHEDMITYNFMYMWGAGIVTVCLVCVFQDVILLWVGDSLLLSVPIMAAMCVYFYTLCMGDVRSLYSAGAGLWWEGRFRSLFEATANILLNIVLGKYFGIMGVIVATLISIVFINFGYGTLIVYRYYFKNGKARSYYLKQIEYCLITLGTCILCMAMCFNIPWNGFWGIIIKALVAFLFSNLCFYLIYCRSEEMKKSKILLKKFRHV